MSTDDSISVIQCWSKILQQANAIGQYTSSIAMRIRWIRVSRGDSDILEKDDVVARFFREKVWVLFTEEEIHKYGSLLRQDYPWLLEFESDQTKKFPGAFSHFDHDPFSLIGILQAYCTLINCEVAKRNMVSYLRRASLEMIRSHSGYDYIPTPMSDLLRRFEKLQGVKDNNQFLERYMNIDHFAIYDHCLSYFTDHKLEQFEEGAEGKEWREIRGRIREFIQLTSPGDDSQKVETLSSCIIRLSMKSLAQSSACREKKLQTEIKKLQEDENVLQKDKKKLQEDNERFQKNMKTLQEEQKKSQKDQNTLQEDKEKLQNDNTRLHEDKETLQRDKKQLQTDNRRLQETEKKLQNDKKTLMRGLEVFDKAFIDMRYRHLLEMLSMARYAASGPRIVPSPQGTPEWQAFWREAWAAAVDGISGPLNDLYNRSNELRRTQIEEEGDRLYEVLSTNVHEFEKEYDIDTAARDRIPGLILSALKPQNFTTAGDVDWEKEVCRFV